MIQCTAVRRLRMPGPVYSCTKTQTGTTSQAGSAVSDGCSWMLCWTMLELKWGSLDNSGIMYVRSWVLMAVMSVIVCEMVGARRNEKRK